MTIFWGIIELCASIFEFSVIINLLNNVALCKFSGYKRLLLNGGMVTLLTGYISIVNRYFVFEGWLSVITILLTILYAFFFFRCAAVSKVVVPILVYSIMLVINVLVTYFLSAIFGMQDTFIFSENDGARLIALFLTKLLFFFFVQLVEKIMKRESLNIKNKESFISVIMSLLTFVVAIALVKIQMATHSEDILFFICILCVLSMDGFILYMMKRLADDNENKLAISMLELQLSEQKSLIEDAGCINTEIKKAEHDLRHHLLSVLGIVESGELYQAERYLKDLLHEYETSIFKYIAIDNSAINSILNLKIGRCHSEKIDVKAQIESDFTGFSDIDLCVLLANLLDNAIEASSKVQNPQIIITIWNEKNYLCLKIANRIDGSVIQTNKGLRTTKADQSKHGYGLYSIGQIVDKYDGIESHYEEQGYFIMDIWLKRELLQSAANYQTRQKQRKTRHCD